MNLKKTASGLALLVFLFTAAGCNLPISGLQQPTAFVFPTPNLTQTALFKPPVIIPPTVTVPAALTAAPPVVSTQAPTSSPVIATATQAPVSTTAPNPTTAAPTKTTAPTTSSRSGPSVTAAHLSKAPNIDGDWGEWTSKAYPAAFVVFGAKNWSNANDDEASYRVGWDSDFLYIAVKVIDDKYVQNASGQDLYKGDSIEVLLDTNLTGDLGSQSLSADDYQIGLSPGKPDAGNNEEAYRWFPSSKAGKPSGVNVKGVSSSGLWRLEAAIPWSTFGVTPRSGMQMGFALSASDNDNSSSNVQQTMVSSSPNRSLVDPTTWGILTLQ